MTNRKSMNFRWFIIGAFLFILLYICYYVTTRGEEYVKISGISGMKVGYPLDSLYSDASPCILVLVGDTGRCTTCTMQVNEWYLYKLDLMEKALPCHILYILNDSVRFVEEVDSLISYYKLRYLKDYNRFAAQNPFIIQSGYDTFLLDKEGRVSLVGSPFANDKLWELYKKQIKKMVE